MFYRRHRHRHQTHTIDVLTLIQQLRERTQDDEIIWQECDAHTYSTTMDGVDMKAFVHGWPRSLMICDSKGYSIDLGLDRDTRRQMNRDIKALYPFIRASMDRMIGAKHKEQAAEICEITSKLPILQSRVQ